LVCHIENLNDMSTLRRIAENPTVVAGNITDDQHRAVLFQNPSSPRSLIIKMALIRLADITPDSDLIGLIPFFVKCKGYGAGANEYLIDKILKNGDASMLLEFGTLLTQSPHTYVRANFVDSQRIEGILHEIFEKVAEPIQLICMIGHARNNTSALFEGGNGKNEE